MTDITLRQFAPILGALLQVKCKYEKAADAETKQERLSHANLSYFQAQAIDEAIKAAIDAATTDAL